MFNKINDAKLLGSFFAMQFGFFFLLATGFDYSWLLDLMARWPYLIVVLGLLMAVVRYVYQAKSYVAKFARSFLALIPGLLFSALLAIKNQPWTTNAAHFTAVFLLFLNAYLLWLAVFTFKASGQIKTEAPDAKI